MTAGMFFWKSGKKTSIFIFLIVDCWMFSKPKKTLFAFVRGYWGSCKEKNKHFNLVWIGKIYYNATWFYKYVLGSITKIVVKAAIRSSSTNDPTIKITRKENNYATHKATGCSFVYLLQSGCVPEGNYGPPYCMQQTLCESECDFRSPDFYHFKNYIRGTTKATKPNQELCIKGTFY